MGIKQPASEIVGKTFGRLTVTEEVASVKNKDNRNLRHFSCLCSCGETCVVWIHNLKRGNSTSCGCKRVETVNSNKHPSDRRRIRSIWGAMRSRCYTPSNPRYKVYGEVGIVIDPLWEDFEVFYNWYKEEHTKVGLIASPSIERIDPNLSYSPENCTLIPRADQARNKKMSKENTTGYTGVRETCDGRFTAFWTDQGVIKNKSFTIALYGYDEAKSMAVKARASAIEDLKNRGVYYGEFHGL